MKDGETGEVLGEGNAVSAANENVCVERFKAYSGLQRLIIMEWTLDNGVRGANHYVTGYPPFQVNRYAEWLKAIENLEAPFDSTGCFA